MLITEDNLCVKCSNDRRCNVQKRNGRENILSMIACVEYEDCKLGPDCNCKDCYEQREPFPYKDI